MTIHKSRATSLFLSILFTSFFAYILKLLLQKKDYMQANIYIYFQELEVMVYLIRLYLS